MKLHLPKLLLTAVLAVVTMTPAVQALSITGTGNLIDYTIDATLSYAGYNVTYSVANNLGTISGLSTNNVIYTFTFDVEKAKETADAALMYAANGSKNENSRAEWGLHVYNGDIVSHWWTSTDTDGMFKETETKSSLDNLNGDTVTAWILQKNVTVAENTTKSGVYLYSGSSTTSDPVFQRTDLYTSTGSIRNAYFNTSLVKTITVKEYENLQVTAGDVSKTLSLVNTAVFGGTGKHEVVAGDARLANGADGDGNVVKKNIVVSGTSQLFLNSWANNSKALDVDRDIYIGSTSYSEGSYSDAAIRFGNNGVSATNLNGNTYIMEDAILVSGGEKAINFKGDVTDAIDGTATGSSLTLKGKGYIFSGDVSLGGLVVNSNAKATFDEESSLTVGSTITNNGSLELNGTFALRNNDLSGFDSTLYSTGGTTNGLSTYGTHYTLVSGTGTLSGSTTQITYDGNTYNIADGIKIEEGSAYVVATNTVQVGGDNAAADTKDAEKFIVLEDATLQLNAREAGAALSAGKVIATAEGEGIIDLRTTATINDATDNSITATSFNGGIKVSSGGVLQLCDNRFPDTGTGETSNRTIDLSSLSGIELAGGELRYRGAGSSLGNITVSANSTLYVFDMHDAANEVTVKKLDLTSSAELSLTSRWKSTTNIKVLSGDGTLNVSAATETNAPKLVKIASTSDFTGKINQTGGTIEATAGLTIGEITQTGGTLKLTNGTTTITKGMDVQAIEATGLQQLTLGTREGNSTTETYKIGQLTGNTAGLNLEVNEGTLELGAQKTNSVALLDLSASDKSDATVTVKNGGTLNITNNLWMSNRDANKINLEEDAQLNVTYNVGSNHQINIKGKEGSATLTNSGNNQYTFAQTTYTISNADVTITDNNSAANVTEVALSNILDGSSLTNSSTKTLKTTNGSSNFTSIDAKSGDINMTYFNQQGNQGTLESLSIGNDRTIGLYKTTVPATPGTADEMSITTKALTVGTNAKLNANLVLANGAKVTMAEALTMGSTLTLGTGMELDGALLTSVTGLTAGNTVDLFTGVDGLTLGSSSYDANTTLELGTETLSSYFGNVTNPDIYLGYDGQKVYAGVMQAPVTPAVPEPTTATLSLLALAGLAARRRRR